MVIKVRRDFVPGPAHKSRTFTSGFRSKAMMGARDEPLTQRYFRRPVYGKKSEF